MPIFGSDPYTNDRDADLAIARASCELETIQKQWVQGLEDEVNKTHREVQILSQKFEDDTTVCHQEQHASSVDLAEMQQKISDQRKYRTDNMDLMQSMRLKLQQKSLEIEKKLQEDVRSVKIRIKAEDDVIKACDRSITDGTAELNRDIDIFKTRWRNRHSDYNVNSLTHVPGQPQPAFQTPQHVRQEHEKALTALNSAKAQAQTVLKNATARNKGAEENLDASYKNRIRAAEDEGKCALALDELYQKLEMLGKEHVSLTQTLRSSKDNMEMSLQRQEATVESKMVTHSNAIQELEQKSERRLLIIIGDGLISDEGYEGRYAWADSAHAVAEAEEAGVSTFYIGVGQTKVDPLPDVFGPRRSTRIRNIEALPGVLARVHRELVAA